MPGSDSVYPDLNDQHWQLVPEHLRPGIAMYLDDGIVPGDFLQAVICNDLKEAAFRADQTNYPRLGDLAKFFYWHTPYACQGSQSKMMDWASMGGLKGMAADESA